MEEEFFSKDTLISFHTNKPITHVEEAKPPTFWCKLCKTVLCSPISALQHFHGRNHKSKMGIPSVNQKDHTNVLKHQQKQTMGVSQEQSTSEQHKSQLPKKKRKGQFQSSQHAVKKKNIQPLMSQTHVNERNIPSLMSQPIVNERYSEPFMSQPANKRFWSQPAVDERIDQMHMAQPAVDERIDQMHMAQPAVDERIDQMHMAQPAVNERIRHVDARMSHPYMLQSHVDPRMIHPRISQPYIDTRMSHPRMLQPLINKRIHQSQPVLDEGIHKPGNESIGEPQPNVNKKSQPFSQEGMTQPLISQPSVPKEGITQPLMSQNVVKEKVAQSLMSDDPNLRCDECKLVFGSIIESLHHFKNTRHGLNSSAEQTVTPNVLQPVDNAITKESKESSTFYVYCDYCNLSFNSEHTAREHFQGKRHKKAISANQTVQEQDILSRWQQSGTGKGLRLGAGGGIYGRRWQNTKKY